MSATLSCDLPGVGLLDCEIVRSNFVVGGERTDAAPGDRSDSSGGLGEAKEATDTVDGLRAMQCFETSQVLRHVY